MPGALTKRQAETREKLLKVRPGATPAEVRSRIAELCELHDYDPVNELIEYVRNSAIDVRQELLDIAKEIEDAEEIDADKICKRLRSLSSVIVGADQKEVIGIHKEVLSYLAPKLRSLDISGQINNDVTIRVEHFGDDGKVIEAEAEGEENEEVSAG